MPDWLPSLNALRAFEAVSRHLSYSNAADDLGVTPAAVKQMVVKLEAAVGQRLVRRQGNGLVLTQAGAEVAPELAQGFSKLAHAVDRLRSRQTRNRLIVSAEPSFAAGWLVPRLDEFRRAHPDIDVLIDSSLHVVDLHGGFVDVAVRYGVTADRSLVSRRLYDDEICAFCSPGLKCGAAAINAPADLSGHTLLDWDLSQCSWATSTRDWMSWSRWLERVGSGETRAADRLVFSDYNLAVQAAVAGQGVILGSWPILRNAVEAGLLVRPFAQGVRTDIGYDLVTTPESDRRPAVMQLVTWMLESVGAGR